MNTHILLASPQMKAVAEAVAAHDPRITVGQVSWKRFPDGMPNLFIHGVDNVQNAHVSFLACLDSPDTIFEQMSLIYALAALAPKSLKILLPYFPTGTMERIDHEGQVATASTLAQMISAVAPAGPGPVPLYLWDIHALPIRHYFGQNISPKFKTGTKLLKERLAGENVSIAFPDEGAWKRFKTMFSEEDGTPLFPLIVCRKVRDGEKRKVTVSEGEVAGRNVVIVDDLIHSGGTTIECLKALKEAGAATVSAYATHGVLEQEAWKKFQDAGFAHVWITDSCPATAAVVKNVAPFEVLSLAPSIARAVMA
jgi:ribose-phosphate pyrophosphokinase